MKQNKQPVLDINQDVALTVNLPFQTAPFVINGSYDAVMPIAEAVQALDSAEPVKRSIKLPKAVVEPPTFVLEGRKATVMARLYDLSHGTSMYEMLKQKREDERNVAFATKLGLLSVDETYCRKHQHAVDSLKH